MRRTRIVDHRGARHCICQVSDLPQGASRALRNSVVAANAHRFTRVWITVLLVTGGMLLGMSPRGFLRMLPVAVVGAVVVGGFTLLATSSLASWRARRAGNFLLETGLCPACGYLLADLAVEGDGCVVCPECSAAWGRAPT